MSRRLVQREGTNMLSVETQVATAQVYGRGPLSTDIYLKALSTNISISNRNCSRPFRRHYYGCRLSSPVSQFKIFRHGLIFPYEQYHASVGRQRLDPITRLVRNDIRLKPDTERSSGQWLHQTRRHGCFRCNKSQSRPSPHSSAQRDILLWLRPDCVVKNIYWPDLQHKWKRVRLLGRLCRHAANQDTKFCTNYSRRDCELQLDSKWLLIWLVGLTDGANSDRKLRRLLARIILLFSSWAR